MSLNFRAQFALDKTITKRYLDLPQSADKVRCTYVFIDGTCENLRSKTRTVDFEPTSHEQLPLWESCLRIPVTAKDGSITTPLVDIYLKPVALFRCPFTHGKNKLVMCETLLCDMQPFATNKRRQCAEIMEQAKDEHAWFGLEQEYTLLDLDGHPFGWPKHGFPAPQGAYHNCVGAGRAFGRDVSEAHYSACLYAGIDVSGTNAECMPSQWEYQVGPVEGVAAGDQLWMSRYILQRVAEDYGIIVSFDPKPVAGEWYGSGCHTNFSTEAMRNKGGLDVIMAAIDKLALVHNQHIAEYDPKGGKDNTRRLTGLNSTASIDQFSYGVGSRTCSIRIPQDTHKNGFGYLEDRRPAANCDPYSVCAALVRTTCVNKMNGALE